MDPHRLNCPAAADADTADTEDWGNHMALFPRSFDFFTSMLVFRFLHMMCECSMESSRA
jgi:hypothetical protein